MLDEATRSEIEEILASYSLSSADLSTTGGFANLVTMTPDLVIRLNSGRFPHAFRHEATVLRHLPSDIPHPEVVGHGARSSGGEYLILERLPGRNLQDAWPALSPADRRTIVEHLAAILQQLHTLPTTGWMTNSWVAEAISAQRWRDAYHADPNVFPHLIESAITRRPALRPMLVALSEFIAARMQVFDDDTDTFIHTDLHFRNVIVADGHVSGMIDFEGSRVGPRDTELDMLIRSLAPQPGTTASPFPGTVSTLGSAYPALFSSAGLREKLEVYEALWHLIQLHNWTTGQTWTTDPAADLRSLLAGDFSAHIDRLFHDELGTGLDT